MNKQPGSAILETEHLLLRPFVADDAEAMFNNWAADPEVTRFLRFTPHASVEVSRQIIGFWLAEYAKPDYFHWAIVCKADGEVIGSLGILYCDGCGDEPEGYSAGYCIGRQWWGKGYTTEALQAAVRHVLAAGVPVLHCCHAVDNPASGRVMQKAGFVFCGPTVYHKPDGSEVPALQYILHAAADKTNS